MNKKLHFLLAFLFLIFNSFGQTKRVSSKDNQTLSRKKEAQKEFSNAINNARSFYPNGIVRCATTEHNKSLQNQKLAVSDEAFENWIAPKIAEIRNKRAQRALPSTIVIPVVVHIVHNGDAVGTGENISLAQALSQIQVFNEDFGKLAGTPGDGAGVDTGIQFCLAQIDPNGNPTNGIVRHNLGTASFDSAGVEAAKAATIWDPTKYLNMWTFRFGGDLTGVLGYAQFPTGSGLQGMPSGECYDDSGSGASTDGVVCAFDTWGSSSYATGSFSAPYDKGRTMTHEVGHMFGLRHIWGDGGCGVDDYCADTPLSDAANFGCPTTNSCTDSPIDYNDQVQNYMDYSDDTCMNIFTQDQKDRMLAVLMNSPRRDDLLVSTVCSSSVLTPYIQFKRQDCDFRPVKEVNEGSDCGGYTELTIPLNIDKAPSANAIVTFAIDGTSQADLSDVQIMTPTVTFNSGSTADQNLVLRILHDGVVETDEDLVISFTINASGGDAIMNPNGNIFSIKILNDDAAPTLTQTYNILYEDFEDASGWLVLDGDGDGRNWGLVNGADGIGTAPNTISGRCAYSEKRLTYLGGAGNASPNNYFISPQITIPTGLTSANLTYIIAGYGSTAGNYTVYFTTDISSAAAINAGTVLQTSSTIGSGASVLRNHNMLGLAGQTGYIVYRHVNNNSAVGLLLLDSVQLQVVKNTSVQTEIDTPTRYESVLNSNGNIYGYDSSNDNIIAGVSNNANFNYGCLSIEVDRSQTSVGSASAQFISPNSANFIVSKTFYFNPTNDSSVATDFDVTLYYTSAEITAWEVATGRSRNELKLVKVSNDFVSAVNYSNFESFVIEEVPATIGAFGTNITFTGNFTNSNLKGGYALATTTGANCGDFSTTWNGSSWSNGAPLRNVAATFTGNYASSGDLEACSIIVTNNATITINTGHTFIVGRDITIDVGSSLSVENNGAVRQIDDLAINTGNIDVKRTSSPMLRLDYTAWSSPVTGQQLQAFSPNTVSTRFYEYLYTGTTTPTAYQSVTSSNNFVAGKGYMIRVDNSWSSVTPSAYNGLFTGVPFNGIINQSVGTGYNLLGNPFASPIDADTFLVDNTSIGTLYFWTNTTPASGGVYPQNNFASYTTLGGTAAFASAKIPNGTIQTGQGFYVQSSASDVIEFNNAQRLNASASTQFFRSSANNVSATASERHRIWLNLNDANTSYNQILVGYMNGATNGIDNLIDGKVLDTSKPMIYSVLNNEEYVIQGKGLPFSDDDIVPLGLKVITAGNYSINIEQVDGLFDNQDIFLRDNMTSITHDLKQGDYQFTTQDGDFKNRFELVFKSGTLSTEDVIASTISVYSNNNGIHINSSNKLDEITVFDVLGRKLFEVNKVQDTQFTIQSIFSTNQALIVKVKDINGNTKTQKLIY